MSRYSTSRPMARSMPRLTRTGLAPASIARMPSRTIAWASTVAVVVPSPTTSLVLIAASLTSWAPMFSNWFLRWISRAIVTPSLVTTGDPVIFSRMTLRPFGPRVDFTASASWSTPASRRARASAPKRSSFAIGSPLFKNSRMISNGPLALRHEDGAPADAACVEVGEGVVGGVERVRLGVQGDPAGLGEGHQLGQLVVGADDVADDVALGGDDVEGRDRDRAAVADDEVGPARRGHVPGVHLGALLGHEVEHDLRALAAGELLDRVDVGAVGDDGVGGTKLLGQLERVGVAVDDDDVRRRQRGEALDADVSEAAGADDDGGGAGVEQRQRLADGVVGGDPGVGEGGDIPRLGGGVELDARPGGREQVLGHSAVGRQAGEGRVLAVHVVARPARVAQAAGRGGGEDDGVADRDVGDGGADLAHPAGVLMAEDVGQRGAHRRVPLAFDDVQVGAAAAGAADLDDHVERVSDRRLGDLVDDRGV